jgi:hypothetical protein
MKKHGGSWAFALAMLALAGCAAGSGPAVADRQFAGTLGQGTLGQGTLGQGTLGQGTLGQGTEDVVWSFSLAGWINAGMHLVGASVQSGRLTATWTSTDACTTQDTSLKRACEWRAGGWATCLPGATMTVGAGGCGLGSSSVDTMLRVCPGKQPCTATQALVSADGPTGCATSIYPSATFTCPASGAFFAMVAPKMPGTRMTFSVASNPGRAFSVMASGADLVGTTIDAVEGYDTNTPVSYTIANAWEAAPSAPPPDAGAVDPNTLPAAPATTYYQLTKTGDPAQEPLCYGENRAIPLSGYWDRRTFWFDSTTNFTFGCMAGVMAKCYLKASPGYRPWDTSDGGVGGGG